MYQNLQFDHQDEYSCVSAPVFGPDMYPELDPEYSLVYTKEDLSNTYEDFSWSLERSTYKDHTVQPQPRADFMGLHEATDDYVAFCQRRMKENANSGKGISDGYTGKNVDHKIKSHKGKKGQANHADDNKREFGCPFYRRQPWNPSFQACASHHSPSIHRLKEHLHRRHTAPIHCPICYTIFTTDERMTKHLKSSTRCTNGSPESAAQIEGMTKDQTERIRSRAGMKGKEEEEKWQVLYKILFPNDKYETPSPYFDDPLHMYLHDFNYFTHILKSSLTEQVKHDLEEKLGPCIAQIDVSKVIKDAIESGIDRVSRDCWRSGLALQTTMSNDRDEGRNVSGVFLGEKSNNLPETALGLREQSYRRLLPKSPNEYYGGPS